MPSSESTPIPPVSDSVDPSRIAPELSQLPPDILQLAADPDSLNGQERTDAIRETERLSLMGTKVIIDTGDGIKRWGKEYTTSDQVWTPRGSILGKFDLVPRDRNDWTVPMQLASMAGTEHMGGADDRVIIETADGTVVIIRKTSGESVSADKQTFDITSSNIVRESDTTAIPRRELKPGMLKDLAVVPGLPLVLGADQKTGKRIKTRAAVTRITTFNSQGKVADNHPRINDQGLQRSTVNKALEHMRAARAEAAASRIGDLAVKPDTE